MLDLFVTLCSAWLQSNFQLAPTVLGVMPSLGIKIYPLRGLVLPRLLHASSDINWLKYPLNAMAHELLEQHMKDINIFDNFDNKKYSSIREFYKEVEY